ncbi:MULTISPECIES: elongator complex protein 3 [Desulfosediminicola]|uniref:elongator complex protein 3 n=1 Tax=Desulfosediminicola TaxID=2886823 RepID=UPI0010AC757A|nr:radical SAM protein [Desulfosediminicola ganghwensis]
MGLVIPLFISHQGCPHQCLFCNQFAITGNGAGNREDGTPGNQPEDGDDPITVIETWLGRSPGYDEVQVAYYGGSFTCLDHEEQHRLLTAVQPYLQAGRVHSIRLSTRPDCISPDIATWLAHSGVKTVELGVQSLDDMVLKSARRGHSAQDSITAMQILRDAGLEVGVQLLPGLPGETTRSFLRGVREVISFAPELVRLYPTVVVENSGLAQMFGRGEYQPLSLNKAVALTRRAKELFDSAGITVARIGLQPSESLGRQVVAGPYHPSFGELVASRNWLKKVRHRLAFLADGKHLYIHISHRDMSALVGMKKSNVRRLKALGFGGRYTIIPEKSRERGSIEYVVS